MSVLETLSRRSISEPQSAALIDVGENPVVITSSELVAMISRRREALAARLERHGVVGQYPRGEVDSIVDCLALEGLGVPSIQISSSDDPPPPFASHVIDADGKLRDLPVQFSRWLLLAGDSPERLIRLANTSGTTGTPKTIAFSRAMVETRLKEYQEVFGGLLGGTDKILSYMGLGSPLGYFMLALAMTLGKAFVVNPGRGFLSESPKARLDCPFVLTSPASCAELWAARKIGLHPLLKFSHIVLAGAHCTSSLRDQVMEVLGAKSYSLYGSAEAGPLAFASSSTIDLDAGEVGLLRKGCGLLQSGGGDDGKAVYDLAVKNGDIEVVPFEVMRGRSWRDAFILLDEAQNTSVTEIKMFLTRIGEGCTTVINGDIAQCDLPQGSGLQLAISLVRERNLPVPVVEFSSQDIVRSGLCAMWVRAFEEKGAPALAL